MVEFTGCCGLEPAPQIARSPSSWPKLAVKPIKMVVMPITKLPTDSTTPRT
jgi:hypothetical protein